MSTVPLSDLPFGTQHSFNSSNSSTILLPVIGGSDSSGGMEKEPLDPRLLRDLPDLAGALLETFHNCADHSAAGASLRRNVIKNCVLSGGSTLHSGFKTRALYEMQSVAGDDAKDLTFWETDNALHAAYRGASLLANSSFRDSTAMITRAEYDEKGCGAIVDKWAF
jgi:hypothetical protein